jgi:hypothetical protein
MDDTKNPLVPPVFEVLSVGLTVLVPVLVLCLAIAALISISRTAHRSLTEMFVWIAIVIFVPVFGPIGWLLVKGSLPKPVA